ncbi:hypothetical protein [Methylocystis sp. Sn-Cys]|uniref:hypothetical protein n=1 Tax=Methylocystis sp. Sn-Cys TaxID=1701263 RepID=UPI0019249D12|nr:hypothetical protein [Methylocystis sp. Sn-Cys]MBL1258153.1 hypothetical protein [Methylocystis sp. Sn-Cys]
MIQSWLRYVLKKCIKTGERLPLIQFELGFAKKELLSQAAMARPRAITAETRKACEGGSAGAKRRR